MAGQNPIPTYNISLSIINDIRLKEVGFAPYSRPATISDIVISYVRDQ